MTTQTVQQLCRALEEAARVAAIIQNRYAAHFQLHVAACLNADKQEMAQRRDELHTILDSMLDNQERIQHLTDEMTKLARQG